MASWIYGIYGKKIQPFLCYHIKSQSKLNADTSQLHYKQYIRHFTRKLAQSDSLFEGKRDLP